MLQNLNKNTDLSDVDTQKGLINSAFNEYNAQTGKKNKITKATKIRGEEIIKQFINQKEENNDEAENEKDEKDGDSDSIEFLFDDEKNDSDKNDSEMIKEKDEENVKNYDIKDH
jgi:hypothetical protein